jgi:hypothetical protein
MKTQTFKQWSSQGYKIKKGSKAVGRTPEGYLFTKDQVEPKPSNYTLSPEDDRDRPEWDEAYDRSWGGW